MTFRISESSHPLIRIHSALLGEQVVKIAPPLNSEERYELVQECLSSLGFLSSGLTQDESHLHTSCSTIQDLPPRIFDLINKRTSPWRSWHHLPFDSTVGGLNVRSNEYTTWLQEISRHLSNYENLSEMIRVAAWHGMLPQTALRDLNIATHSPHQLANQPLTPNNVPLQLRRNKESLQTLLRQETLDRYRRYSRDQQLRKYAAVANRLPDFRIAELLNDSHHSSRMYIGKIANFLARLVRKSPTLSRLYHQLIPRIRKVSHHLRSRIHR